jgi:hypothetical protein
VVQGTLPNFDLAIERWPEDRINVPNYNRNADRHYFGIAINISSER